MELTEEKEIEKLDEQLKEDMGRKLLKENYELIKITIKEYLDIKEDYVDLLALWIIGTYFHKEFEAFPYLFINAMRGSAKTRLIKLIAALEDNGEVLTSLTEAVLFRQGNPLGIDEFESIGHKDKNALRELLNTAYKKGSKVKRMRKIKNLLGEQQVVEEFNTYRPIHMANIWGMDEVLGDRCINIYLEKSSNKAVTKLMEDYANFPLISQIKTNFKQVSVVKCSVVMVGEYIGWHYYIKLHYTPNYTSIHLTTPNYTKHLDLYDKIDKADIDGRNLELFFPLFLIANKLGQEELDNIIRIAKEMVSDRKIEEVTESKDVMLYSFISKRDEAEAEEFIKVNFLTMLFRKFIGEDEEEENRWLNSKWMGRALRRLNLIKKKKRMGEGVEVILDIKKAKEKMEIFK